ncbi:MAG: carboxypeptidase-like regulatory domain-containing protein [Clostridia bacterium]|nr:carboxypeptidase-like regulatory domain-containing protein [Clostridia bacterium]
MRPVRLTGRHLRLISIGALLAALTLMLTGCFGPNPPKPQFVSLSGTVSAPPDEPYQGSSHSIVACAVDHTPVNGASVAAFDFANGKQVGVTATTSSNGGYTISNIPKGIDVVVIATAGTGTRNGSGMRLSALIADASQGAGGDIDGVTSLVAEAWGKFFRQARNVAITDLRTTHFAAMRVLERLGWLDLAPDGAILYRDYGNGLKPDGAVGEVTGSVPGENDSQVWPAKEMIQDLRDAGLTLKGTYEQEIADPSGHIATNVAPYLEAVAMHVGGLHPQVMQQRSGCRYREKEDGEFVWAGPYLEGKWLLERFNEPYEEEWTKVGVIPLSASLPERWTLRDVASGEIAFEVKNTADRFFVFNGRLSVTMDDSAGGLPTEAHIDAELRDPENPLLAEATTLTGEYHGSFGDQPPTVEVSVEGAFRSPHVNADGTLTISGDLDSSGEVEFSGSIRTDEVTLSGSIELSAVKSNVITIGDIPLLAPNDVRINGSFAKVGVTEPIFEGNAHITLTNAAGFDFRNDPAPGNWPEGTVDFSGSVNPPGKASVLAHIVVSTRSYKAFTATVRYDHGSRWLDGTASYDGSNDARHTGALQIQNQAGLKVNIQMVYISERFEATGTIKNASNAVIGEIETDSDGLVRIIYEDDSWESLS